MNIIVAIDEDNGIGKDNTLPWHHKEDLARFKELTTEHSIIMGRKTMESLGRPLKNRKNIVVTSRLSYVDHTFSNRTFREYKPEERDGFFLYPNIVSAALNAGEDYFVIGGQSIYEQFLPWCKKIYLTRIPGRHDCDRFFRIPENFIISNKEMVRDLIFEEYIVV